MMNVKFYISYVYKILYKSFKIYLAPLQFHFI